MSRSSLHGASSRAATSRPEPPPGPIFLLTLVSITLVSTMTMHFFLPVMPEVKKAFASSDGVVGATFSMALFVMAASTLVYGSLADRLGRRPVLLSGLALFCAGSLISVFAVSIEMLIAGRVVQALGAGCGVTISRAIARDRFGADQKLVTVISYLAMASTLGPTFSPLIGGLLVDSVGWRGALWFAVLMGVLVLTAAWRVLAESRPAGDDMEESRGALRNFASLLRNPLFLGYVFSTGMSSGTFMGVAAALAFLMKDTLGRSATEFGLYFMLFPTAYSVGMFCAARLSTRMSMELQILIGGIGMALMVAAQAAALLAGYLSAALLALPWAAISFAQGLITPNAQAGAIRVRPHLAGTASGLTMFIHFSLGALFSQIYLLIADGTAVPMVIVMTVGTGLTLVFCVLAWVKRPRS